MRTARLLTIASLATITTAFAAASGPPWISTTAGAGLRFVDEGAGMNQPWMRRPSTSCQRSIGATMRMSRHASPIRSLIRRSATVSLPPSRPAGMSPTTTFGTSVPLARTAATRAPPRGVATR